MELFIERQQVDINEAFSSLLTLAIDDIRDFSAKNTTFSKTIILPGTKRNNALFGNIFEVSSGNEYNPLLPNQGINFNAAVSAQAYIFSDNIQVFKGILRLMEVVIDNGSIEYEVSVFGELGGFAAKLGNLKLESLDFSAYDHQYTITNIVNSWDHANAGQGYVYPLIDYGNTSFDKHNWKYSTFRPALFAKEYIDKIFEASGYQYDCDLFQTDRFKRLIVPFSQKAIQKVTSAFLDVSGTGDYNSAISYNIDLPVRNVSLGDFSYSGGYLFTYGGPNVTGDISLEMNVTYTKVGSQIIYVRVEKNGAEVITKTLIVGASGVPVTDSFTISQTGLSVNPGDTIDVRVFSNGLGGPRFFNFNIHSSRLSFSPTDGGTALVPISLGDTYEINQALPKNILQKDFILSIVKLFNLYVYEDGDYDRILKITPFVDFFADEQVVDWSLKLDRSKPVRIKPMSELNARYYQFNFKGDSDYYNDLYKKRYNQTYGSLIYDSNFEFSKENQPIDVIFSGTPLVGYSAEEKIYSTIFKRTGEDLGQGEESIDFNIRLLLAKKIAGVSSWNLLDTNGSTIIDSYTDYCYAGHFDDPDTPTNDIQFGVPKELFFTLVTGAINVNQFNVYWSSYMAEITDKDSRLMTATFKLDFKDIYNLSFAKFIWIDGSLFRLNKIIDFNATHEDTCTVELLKVINKTYSYE
jgi:hypothetical protein